MQSTETESMDEAAGDLSPLQLSVIEHLAAGARVQETAAHFNIHRNTISKWNRTNAFFRSALDLAKYEEAMHWRAHFRKQAEQSAETISEVMTDRKNSASVRLRAATLIFKQATEIPRPAPFPAAAAPAEPIPTLEPDAAPIVPNTPESRRATKLATDHISAWILMDIEDHKIASHPPFRHLFQRIRSGEWPFDPDSVKEHIQVLENMAPETFRRRFHVHLHAPQLLPAALERKNNLTVDFEALYSDLLGRPVSLR